MIRRDRHASADELASLEVGELRSRKAARIEAHVAKCDHCTRIRRELGALPTILASAHYPPMPTGLTVRIEAMLAVESRQRLAALPATEADRRDLPAAHSRRTARRGWHLPGFSVPATRLVAAAGALAVVAGGGYAIASQALSGPASSVSHSSATSAAQPMSQGPDITYGPAGAQHTIHSVRSSTDFVPSSLSSQAAAAVHTAQARGAAGGQSSTGAPAPSKLQNNSAAGSAAPGGTSRLAGCINLIAAARTVLLVDAARFEHKPATLIVIGATVASPAEAWVVGSSCSATAKDVLAHTVIGHL